MGNAVSMFLLTGTVAGSVWQNATRLFAALAAEENFFQPDGFSICYQCGFALNTARTWCVPDDSWTAVRLIWHWHHFRPGVGSTCCQTGSNCAMYFFSETCFVCACGMHDFEMHGTGAWGVLQAWWLVWQVVDVALGWTRWAPGVPSKLDRSSIQLNYQWK